MESPNLRELHLAGWLLLSGAIAFWIGAFSPPYKQWYSPLDEYLKIVGTHRINWYWIHGCFLVGVLLTVAGLRVLTVTLRSSGQILMPELGFAGFFFGSVLWVVSITFRVTADLQAGITTVETGSVPAWIVPLHQWSGVMFAVYMVLAYLSIAAYGDAILQSGFVPVWAGKFTLYFGLAGSVLFLVGFPVFAPPLMIHLPLGLIGLLLIRK